MDEAGSADVDTSVLNPPKGLIDSLVGRAPFIWRDVQKQSGKLIQLLTAIAVLAVIAVVVGLNWFRLQDALKTFYRRK